VATNFARLHKVPKLWVQWPRIKRCLRAESREVEAPRPGRIYVANEQSNNVSVIDAATDVETKKIPVGSRPLHIALSP
jgi:YVTN family beta-propeller protein